MNVENNNNDHHLSKCNLKDDGFGVFDLHPLYVGFFFQENYSESMPIVSAILNRLYGLQQTSDYLKEFLIRPIFGYYSIEKEYSIQLDKYFEENENIEISVVFSAVPHNVSKTKVEEVPDRYKTLIFNLDYSVNINSYYNNQWWFINEYILFIFI